MPPNISSPGVHRAQYVPFNAAKVVKGLSLANIRNEKQDPFRCGMSSVSGADHRNALGLAMSKAQDVMARASGTSAEQKACIQKTVGWLNSAGAGGIGNIVLQRLTALGASHSAVVDLLKDTPRDDNLRSLEAQVNKMIVDLGIAIGDCRTPPQGTALNRREAAVSKLDDKADLCIKSCASSIGGQKFMEAIGRVILPQPIMNALVEKRPDLIEKISKDGAASVDLTEVLNARALRSVQQAVDVELDSADAQAAVSAIIQLLKIPELVIEGDPGKEGPRADKEKGVSDLPRGVRELAGDGKNVAVNYNDFGKMGNKSTVDGANAARLAELDVEKHRITIDGMLAAFKLGLEGHRCCGHLITGIRNTGGHIGTPAHDLRHATSTGSIEVQTDLVENDQLNGESVNHEIHAGSNDFLNHVEEGVGTLHPQSDPVTDTVDASAHTRAEGDVPVGHDDTLVNIHGPDPSVRVMSHNDYARSSDVEALHEDQNQVRDDVDLDKEFDTLEQRLPALRTMGFDQEDVHQRTENETLRQAHPPLTNVTETVNAPKQPSDADEDQNPPQIVVLGDGARAGNENISQLDDDAASSSSRTSSVNLDDRLRTRAGPTTPSEDEGAAKDAAAKLFRPVNPNEELKVYFDELSADPITRRLVMGVPPRVVRGYQEVVNAAGRKEMKPELQEASRFALNFGAHAQPSDLVRFQKERNIVKVEPWRGARHSVEPSKDEYLEFKRVINARDAAFAAGFGHGKLNIREELKRINAELGQNIAGQKTEGKVFERAAKWADAASGPVVPDARDPEVRSRVTAPQDRMAAVGQWVQSQPQQRDPVEPESDATPFGQPVPRAQDQHAGVRDMLNNLLAAQVQRNPSLVGLFKGDAAPKDHAATSHSASGARVAKKVRFDLPLNSVGSSAAPSEASDDDSINWEQGTPEQLMDERSLQLDKTRHFVPNPPPLPEKPPVVVGERDAMPVFRSGLTQGQNQRMMQ